MSVELGIILIAITSFLGGIGTHILYEESKNEDDED